MKYRFIAVLLFVCIGAFGLQSAPAQDPAAYAVADATSGFILDSHNPGKKLPIASLTKIATALVALDWLELSKHDQGTLVAVPAAPLAFDPQNNPLGFQPGDQVSIRDLMYAMLIQSDNIAAYTLADYIGRDLQRGLQAEGKPVDIFVGQMNALARKLGMDRTKFLNPMGLDTESPYSTARDLVYLSRAGMERAPFRFIVSQRERRITIRTADGRAVERTLTNTNKLLGSHAIDGVKTGTSARAGECVVLSASRSPEAVQNPDGSFTVTPRRIIVVVLGSENRFNDATQLLNNGWNLYNEWAAKGRPLEK